LKGEAAGSDGLVTFRDVADYVRDQVREYGVKVGQVQVPFEAGESSGDFLLARTSGRPPVPDPVTIPSGLETQHTGQTKLNPKDGLTYVWIEPGNFMIGCSPLDKRVL
jgi:hypothetical protein